MLMYKSSPGWIGALGSVYHAKKSSLQIHLSIDERNERRMSAICSTHFRIFRAEQVWNH